EAGRGTVVAALAAERGCHARCVLSSAVYRTQIPASAWPDEYPARLGARGRRRRGSVVATGEATSPATTPLRRHPASLGHRERRRRHGLPGAALHVLDVRLVPVAAWREVGGELDVKTGLLARRQGAELHGAEAVLRDGLPRVRARLPEEARGAEVVADRLLGAVAEGEGRGAARGEAVGRDGERDALRRILRAGRHAGSDQGGGQGREEHPNEFTHDVSPGCRLRVREPGGRRRREAIERACRMRGGPLARRRGTTTPTCAGSSPKLPARRDFNARHLLRGAWADPNSPTWCTVRKPAPAPGGLGPTPETPAR